MFSLFKTWAKLFHKILPHIFCNYTGNNLTLSVIYCNYIYLSHATRLEISAVISTECNKLSFLCYLHLHIYQHSGFILKGGRHFHTNVVYFFLQIDNFFFCHTQADSAIKSRLGYYLYLYISWGIYTYMYTYTNEISVHSCEQMLLVFFVGTGNWKKKKNFGHNLTLIHAGHVYKLQR